MIEQRKGNQPSSCASIMSASEKTSICVVGRTVTGVLVATLLMCGLLMLKRGAPLEAATIEVTSKKVLSTRGSTRGTAYYMSNKILTLGDKTHVAWLDTKAAIMIQTLDHSTGRWLPTVRVGSGVDNHAGAALCSDSNGYLHAAFGPHGGPLQYWVSERPNDASSWVRRRDFGDNATYPSLVCGPDNTLYCCYRGKPAPCKMVFQRKPVGADWSEPTALLDAEVDGGYTHYQNAICVAPDGTLHVAFHIYFAAVARAAGHLQSSDGGNTWTLADGTAIGLPYTAGQPGWIEQGRKLDLWVGNVDVDPEGDPYVVIMHYETKPYTAKLWRFEGGHWDAIELAPIMLGDSPEPGLQMAYYGAGPVCFDDKGNLYVMAGVFRPGSTLTEDEEWGHPTNEQLLLYSEDRGETFEVLPISPRDDTASDWLPSLERHAGHNRLSVPHLLYTHGRPGKGCTPPDVTEIRFATLGKK